MKKALKYFKHSLETVTQNVVGITFYINIFCKINICYIMHLVKGLLNVKAVSMMQVTYFMIS